MYWRIIFVYIIIFYLPVHTAFGKTKGFSKKTIKLRLKKEQSKKTAKLTQKAKASGKEEKTAVVQAKIIRSRRFRFRYCRISYHRLSRNIRRRRLLIKRLERFECNPKHWMQCTKGTPKQQQDETCQGKKIQKKWQSCFRIERRLHVITIRLANEMARITKHRRKCRWSYTAPSESYEEVNYGKGES